MAGEPSPEYVGLDRGAYETSVEMYQDAAALINDALSGYQRLTPMHVHVHAHVHVHPSHMCMHACSPRPYPQLRHAHVHPSHMCMHACVPCTVAETCAL